MYLPWLEPTDVLDLGEVTGDSLQEILIASRVRDTITWLDTNYGRRLVANALPTTPEKDILVFVGYGSPSYWDVLDDFPYGFGNSRPFAWAASCLTGNYEDAMHSDGIAEAFFDRGGECARAG